MTTVLALVVLLAVVHVPLGDYIAWVFTSPRHWRAERLIYRLAGVAPDGDQRWRAYLSALLAFSATGILVLYALLRGQAQLPYAVGHPGMPAAPAFNTAVSFS